MDLHRFHLSLNSLSSLSLPHTPGRTLLPLQTLSQRAPGSSIIFVRRGPTPPADARAQLGPLAVAAAMHVGASGSFAPLPRTGWEAHLFKSSGALDEP
jgi:hypothetical protein